MSLSGISLTIEQMAVSRGSIIEAIVDFAEDREIDIEEVASVLHPQIIQKLKLEFIEKNHFANKKSEPTVMDFSK